MSLAVRCDYCGKFVSTDSEESKGWIVAHVLPRVTYEEEEVPSYKDYCCRVHAVAHTLCQGAPILDLAASVIEALLGLEAHKSPSDYILLFSLVVSLYDRSGVVIGSLTDEDFEQFDKQFQRLLNRADTMKNLIHVSKSQRSQQKGAGSVG